MAKMTDTEIAAVVSAEIEDSVSYRKSDRDQDIEKAVEYYRGEMSDLPAEEGRSSVVDHTTQDVIGWILPGLMRVFFGGEQIVVYEPKGPEDVGGAEQATDYVNYVVRNECDGYQVCWDVFHDALLHRNGIFKHYWDPTPQTKVHVFSCLDENQMAMLIASDEIEVLEHTERDPEMVETPQGPMPVIYHDLKVKRTDPKGRLRICAVPPEHFLIDRAATDIDDARFVGERLLKTRSELMEMGFDRETVEKLPAEGGLDLDGVDAARRENWAYGGDPSTWATEEIEVFEVYPLADIDGDGIAERLKVLAAGPSGAEVLDWEVWEDDVPYSDLTPERVPHRWSGRSVFDDTQDIQRIKSVLMRQTLDNLYQTNIPDRVVELDSIHNPDAIYDRQIGNTILAKQGLGASAVTNLVVPFTAQHSFTALEYMDQVIERRTGVSRSSMGLDPETLQNQSATAANIQQAASYSKIELVARNFAEMGLKRAFKQILKLIVKHQDRPRTIRLRNEWVEMDPRVWNADMDATINIGLGSGSRDRDLMMLVQIVQQQKEVLGMVGGMASSYGQKLGKALHHTLSKMVEATGLRNPEMFFPEIDEADMKSLAEAAKQNPEAQKEMAKVQAQSQADMAKAQMDGQLRQQEMQAEGQLKREQMAQDGQLKREQISAEMALKREQLIAELELKRELGLATAAMNADAKVQSATSGVHPGGEPG